MGLFGGGNTSSQTQNYTENTDGRVVADGGGYGVSGKDSTIYINATDAGAVKSGRDVALYGLESNATNVGHLLDTMDRLFQGQTKVVDISAALASSMAAKATGTADEGLKTAAGQNNKLLLLGAVALAVVAFMRGGR